MDKKPIIVGLVGLATLAACGSDPPGSGPSGTGGIGGSSSSSSSAAGGTGGSSSSSGGAGGGAQGPLAAFPGAQGFGTDTPGGRGGRVVEVTTLDASGPGSLEEALLLPEPRTVVFRVSGVIDWPAEVALGAEHSFLTVAGQTSPGGITIRGGGALVTYHAGLHDVVLRFLRFRGNGNYDNLSFAEIDHLVIDHCDFSGASDEALDITYARDVTIQWSTITNSGPDGQRYGFLLAYPPTTNISMHHTLSAHHVNRCAPHMHWADVGVPAEGAQMDFRNNVIYNCAFEKVWDITGPDAGEFRLNFVGNYAKAGPSTPSGENTVFAGFSAATSLFNSDNVYAPNFPIESIFSEPMDAAAAHPFPEVDTQSAAEALDAVLASVGAFPRDPMNLRTIAEVQNGTGTLGQVGDALIESGPPPEPDSDHDGMSDAWETAHQLDPADPDDGPTDLDGDGYTNLEEYLHDVAVNRLMGL
jgi:hypothetical protein